MKSVRALAIIGDFFDPLARSEVVPGLVTEAPVVPGSRVEAVGGAVGAEPVGPVDREPELGISFGVDQEPELGINVGVDREPELGINVGVDREPELGINVGVALVGGACLVLVSWPIDIRVLSAVCRARE